MKHKFYNKMSNKISNKKYKMYKKYKMDEILYLKHQLEYKESISQPKISKFSL